MDLTMLDVGDRRAVKFHQFEQRQQPFVNGCLLRRRKPDQCASNGRVDIVYRLQDTKPAEAALPPCAAGGCCSAK